MTEKKIVDSLVPRDARRDVELSRIARSLSYRVSSDRHEHDFHYSFENFVKTHRPEANEEILEAIKAKVIELVNADQVYDSEANQAYRALFPTFMELLPTKPMAGYPVYTSINIQGWIPGEVMVVNRERFELTGDSCPQCGVNPKAYGTGGGVRCVDTRNCRWWYCA
jgi:hypothetical protein